jgi:hypothetical protein
VTAFLRLAVAFLVAALVAIVIVGLIVTLTSGVPPIGFVVTVAAISALVTVVIGIPAYFLSRAWHLTSLRSYAAVGGVVALVPAGVLAAGYPESIDFIVAAVLAGIASGFAFGSIVKRTSNKSLQRTG